MKIFCTVFVVFAVFFNVAADNEKALKYLKLCLSKSSSKYLFDHLYDNWNDDTLSLEQKLKKGLSRDNNYAYQRLLVRLFEREGRDNEALSACEKLLKKAPGESALLLIKARLEFNEHNYEQCVKDLSLALKDKKLSAKKAVEIKKMLGSAYLRMDKEKQALAVWKKLYADNHELDFGEDVLQLMFTEGMYEEAKSFCEQLIKEFKKDKFRSLELSIKLAEIYRLKGSRKEALESYRKILAETGTGSWLEKEIFSRIVQIYQAEDDIAGLLKFTAAFLKEFNARSAVRLRYIDILFSSGAEQKALEAYRELIRKAPLNKDYRVAYAKMLIKAKKYKLAVNVYTGLVKRFPKNSELLFSQALVEIKADIKNAALASIKAYIVLNNTNEYAYIRAAKVMENAKMFEAAGKFYKEFMGKFPASVDAMETYAVWLLRSGKTEEAVKLLTSSGDLPLPILLRRSKLLLNYKQISEACAFLLRFQKKYKNDFRFNEELFVTCAALKKQDKVIKMIPVLLDTAVSWDELNRALSSSCYVLSKYDLSEKYLRTLENSKDLKSNMYCLLAVLQSRFTGDDKAMITIDRAIRNAPGKLMLYRQKTALLNSAGEYVKAAAVFKELLKLDKKARATIYKQLISLYGRADKNKEAIKWAAKLKREFPDSLMSWLIFARLQEQTGKPEEAIKTLGRAVYRFPNNDELRRQLVSAYSGKGDMRGAINICWKILLQSSSLGSKLGMISKIYKLSRTETLKDALQSRLQLQRKNNPRDIFPLLALAETAKLAYKHNEYRDYIQKASRLGNKSVYLLYKLADIDEEQGSYAAAERILKKICEQDTSGKARMKLADFYFRSGDDEKALEIYRSYLRDHNNIKGVMRFAGDMIVRKRPEEAIAILRDQAVASNNCALHYLLACAYEDTDKTELAVKEFMRVIKLSDTLKTKAKLTPVKPIRIWWGVKTSPAMQRLAAIQMMNYQVYRYQQQRYSQHSRLGGMTSSNMLLPTSADDAKIMTICHLGRLSKKLSASKQRKLLKFLEACGVKYPDLAILATEVNFNNISIDITKLLKKYANDLDMKFYLCMRYHQQIAQRIGKAKLNKILLELCRKRPEQSSMLIYVILQNNFKKNNEIIDLALNSLLKEKKFSQQNIQMLVWVLINKKLKLKQTQKDTIRNLMVKHFKKLRQQNKITSPYVVYSIINALLQRDFIKDATELIKIELERAGKTKKTFTPYMPPHMYRRPGQGLNFTKQVFPAGALIKLPGLINFVMQQRYGTNRKIKLNFFKACAGIKDIQVKLIVADRHADKKSALETAAAINADPKADLSQLALIAAWYSKENEAEKACEILLRARRLLKNKKDRKELNSRLIVYALLIKDKEKIKKYISDAAKKLLRLNLDLKEKVSLAAVLQLAGLNKEAEKIEGELLKKGRGKGATVSRRPGSRANFDIFRRAEEKFKNNETKLALNLMTREYHRWFRQIYSSFNGQQFNAFSTSHQLTRICQLVKKHKSQDLMLERLLPAADSLLIKRCEYAWACQNLGKSKIAEKTYKEILEKHPKSRFAVFQHAMLLMKDNYSSAAPVLKKVSLEDLMLISNNLHNFFKTAEHLLNFYDLLIMKMKEKKKIDSLIMNNRVYLLNNLLNYLTRDQYLQAEQKSYPGVFSAAASPEKYKNKFTKTIPRQRELYLKLCDQIMRVPGVAENAFCHKLLLFELLKWDTSSFFEQGLKVMRLVNKSNINYFNHNIQVYYNNQNHSLPDFDSYMVIAALKSKRLPELLQVAKDCNDPESATRQIKDLEKLATCPEVEFLRKAQKFVDGEDNPIKRGDFQKLIVAIYKYRKLNCNLTGMMFKEIKLYEEDLMQSQNRFVGLEAWIMVVAQQKKPKLLAKILRKLTDFCVKKYKKEFPNEIDVQSRFHQVFPWMLTNVFRKVIQNILQKTPENYYVVYRAFKPMFAIKMFANQINSYHLFSQQINSNPVKLLKQSPFLGTLKEIDFCVLKQYDGKATSLYNMIVSRIRHNSKWKKETKKYFKSIKKPQVGVKLFNAVLKSSPDKIFEILAEPQLKFAQMPLKWQKKFCTQLSSVFNNKTVSNKFNAKSKGWKLYQFYQKFTSSSNQKRVEKFYKQDVGNNYWRYTQEAGSLIANVAKQDTKKAMKLFEHAIRKLELSSIQYPNQRSSDLQRSLLDQLRNNCRDLKTCRVYYECMSKIKKISVNMLNTFYDKLQNSTCQRYNNLNKDNKQLLAVKALFKEYEDIFKNSKLIITYNNFNVLNQLSVKQLQELIKYRASLKIKSKLSSQINLILRAYLENKQKHKVSPETAVEMWAKIKDLPSTWRVALGLLMLRTRGCEQISQFLVEPALKMALRGDRQISSYNIQQLVEKLGRIKDDKIIKKIVPPLINYYILEIYKWDENHLKNQRVLVAQLLALAYRAGKKKIAGKLLDGFKMAQYSDSYIALANLGAKGMIKTSLGKEWRKLTYYPQLKLTNKGLICAGKICEEIKDTEEKYVVEVLFATSQVYCKDKNGEINYRSSTYQTKTVSKLAKEFSKIKFSKKTSKIFCIQALVSNSHTIKILAENTSDQMLSLSFDDIFGSKDHSFAYRMGQFYFICLQNGNSKAVIEKINKLIQYKTSTNRNIEQKAKRMLNGMAQSYQSLNMHKITIKQAKELARPGQMLCTEETVQQGQLLQYTAFFNYLAGTQKEFIAVLKKIPQKRIQSGIRNWRHYMGNLNVFCKNNKLDVQKEMTGFLNSPLIKDIFKKKAEELAKLKTYYIQANCNDFKQFKAYYESLLKNKKISINEINQFYSKLQQFIYKRYNELRKKNNNNKYNAIKALLKEYDDIFKNSNMPMTYESFNVFNYLNKNELQVLVNFRNALKSKKSAQLDLLVKAYLEMKQNYKLSPDTVQVMWTKIKDFPEIWQVALGIKMQRMSGKIQISQFLVEPFCRVASRKNIKISPHAVKMLLENLARIKDDMIIKKVFPSLQKYYMQKIKNWNQPTCRNNRKPMSHFLNLVYRTGNKKLVEELIKKFKMAQYSDTYIALANVGAKDLIITLFDENWQNIDSPPLPSITKNGILCAQKIYKKIKDSEKKYIAKVLFGSAYIPRGHNVRIAQWKALKVQAEEFGNISFSNEKNKLFCFLALLREQRASDVLAKKWSTESLTINADKLMNINDYNLNYQLGIFYITSLQYNEKTVIERINELIKLHTNVNRKIKSQAQQILNACLQAYSTLDLREIKMSQVKGLAHAGRLIFIGIGWQYVPWKVAFFNYIAGEQKEFIAAIKKTPDSLKRFNNNNWRYKIRNFKTFCKNNNLDGKKEILGFLDSALVKELFKKKTKDLGTLKKYMSDIFAKESKQAKLNKN